MHLSENTQADPPPQILTFADKLVVMRRQLRLAVTLMDLVEQESIQTGIHGVTLSMKYLKQRTSTVVDECVARLNTVLDHELSRTPKDTVEPSKVISINEFLAHAQPTETLETWLASKEDINEY